MNLGSNYWEYKWPDGGTNAHICSMDQTMPKRSLWEHSWEAVWPKNNQGTLGGDKTNLENMLTQSRPRGLKCVTNALRQ